jgi:hypothetical protein
MTKAQLQQRVLELESQNAALRSENLALRGKPGVTPAAATRRSIMEHARQQAILGKRVVKV